jgi:hypothetical protein
VFLSADSCVALENVFFEYTVEAEDPDGNPISCQFFDYPAWLSVSGLTISGTPAPGTPDCCFNVSATDGNKADTLTVQISVIPNEFKLYCNYPNPFNSTTTIRFSIPSTQKVHMDIFDLRGRVVARLVDGPREAGNYEESWNPGNLASGLYLARLQAGGLTKIIKLVLQR